MSGAPAAQLLFGRHEAAAPVLAANCHGGGSGLSCFHMGVLHGRSLVPGATPQSTTAFFDRSACWFAGSGSCALAHPPFACPDSVCVSSPRLCLPIFAGVVVHACTHCAAVRGRVACVPCVSCGRPHGANTLPLQKLSSGVRAGMSHRGPGPTVRRGVQGQRGQRTGYDPGAAFSAMVRGCRATHSGTACAAPPDVPRGSCAPALVVSFQRCACVWCVVCGVQVQPCSGPAAWRATPTPAWPWGRRCWCALLRMGEALLHPAPPSLRALSCCTCPHPTCLSRVCVRPLPPYTRPSVSLPCQSNKWRKRDPATAAYFLTAACKMGHGASCVNLAAMIARGDGVKKARHPPPHPHQLLRR